jgi:SagB-type dehydrogenase family enzyme
LPEYESEIIKLPEPKYDGSIPVEEALLRRRSVRDFKDVPLTISEVSQLVWAAEGITGAGGRRTFPSAGALYPLELYVIAGDVNGLPPGIYKYKTDGHKLLRIEKGDRRSDLRDAALGQSSVKRAPAVIVLSAVYERTTTKYGERGIRYIHMEAGHAAQNVYLQAVSLGLGTVVIGAFRDEEVRRVMKMTDGERPLYLMPVGKK